MTNLSENEIPDRDGVHGRDQDGTWPMSFAIFARGSNEVVATSIPASSAEFSISAIKTNEIAIRRSNQLEPADSDRDRRDQDDGRDREVDAEVALSAQDVNHALEREVEALEQQGARRRDTLTTRRLRLAAVHVRAVLIAEEVQQRVHERRPPGLTHDLRAENRIA